MEMSRTKVYCYLLIYIFYSGNLYCKHCHVDAAPDRGHVSLSIRASDNLELSDPSRGTHHEGPGVLIEVRDDGPGFAEGDLARIFRPFYTTKSSGTGLGLAICHKIVAAHDGQITAGRALDHTFFRVLLPRDTKSLAMEKAQNKEQT
jgi:signal transduction histidine kinase